MSGNWCWIQDSPTYLRYVLTHGWRFVIIFIVSGLCIYIQIYLRRHLRFKASLDQSSLSRSPYIQLDRSIMPSLGGLGQKKVQVSEEDEEEMIDRGLSADASKSEADCKSSPSVIEREDTANCYSQHPKTPQPPYNPSHHRRLMKTPSLAPQHVATLQRA